MTDRRVSFKPANTNPTNGNRIALTRSQSEKGLADRHRSLTNISPLSDPATQKLLHQNSDIKDRSFSRPVLPVPKRHALMSYKTKYASESNVSYNQKVTFVLQKTLKFKKILPRVTFDGFRGKSTGGSSYSILYANCVHMMDGLISCKAEVPEEIVDQLKNMAMSSFPEEGFVKLLTILSKLQDLLYNYLTTREEHVQSLLNEFEKMEESRELFSQVVEQKAKFSTNNVIEIQVKPLLVPQSSRNQSNLDDDETPEKHNPAIIKRDFATKEAQTDYINFDNLREDVDVMDVATGPDREIPVYRSVAVSADLRHPIEDKMDELKTQYEKLEAANETLKYESELMLENIKKEFQLQIRQRSFDTEKEVGRLNTIVADLQSENDRLEKELLTVTEDRAVKELELKAIREQMDIASYQVATLEKKKEEERIFKEKMVEHNKQLEAQVVQLVEAQTKAATEIKQVRLEKEIFATKNREYAEEIFRLNETTKIATETAEKVVKSEEIIRAKLTEEVTKRQELEIKHEELQKVAAQLKVEEKILIEQKETLDDIIARLMQFPDLSVERGFVERKPPYDEEYLSTLHHMIEHNNLRISLLEQKNNRFREILLNEAISEGYEDYTNYYPLSGTHAVFNRNAIVSRPSTAKSRPTTADSTRTATETYIIGNKARSRPVSAATIRLLRPVPSEAPMEKRIESPLIYSTVKNGHINIQENFKTKYPPRNFPAVNTVNPLATYDGVILEEEDLTIKKSVNWTKERPPSGTLYRWKERAIE